MTGAVKLNTPGGGNVVVQPASSIVSDVTVNVPSHNCTLVAQNASNNLLMNSGYGSDAVAYGCRAWVEFNGTGTVAIRASGNVSSITDNGVGDFTINFTNAMPDANYAVGGSTGYSSDYYGAAFLAPNRNGSNGFVSAPTASACRVNSQRYDGNVSDPTYASVLIYR